MKFTSERYPRLRVAGVTRFTDGAAEVTDSKAIAALKRLERYGVKPVEEPKAKPKREE